MYERSVRARETARMKTIFDDSAVARKIRTRPRCEAGSPQLTIHSMLNVSTHQVARPSRLPHTSLLTIAMLTSAIAALAGTSAQASSGSGTVPAALAMADQRPIAPPPTADTDRDGTPDADDLCTRTTVGARGRHAGCSMLDLVIAPDPLVHALVTRMRDAQRAFARQPGMAARARTGTRIVSGALARIQAWSRRVAMQPCVASRTVAGGVRAAARGVGALAQATASARRAIVIRGTRAYVRRRGTRRDADGDSARLASLAAAGERVREQLVDLRTLSRMAAEACRASRGVRAIRARVVSVDHASASAKLADGTTLALGAVRRVVGLAPGVVVTARGISLAAGVLVAQDVAGQGIAVVPEQSFLCALTPTIAPVQDFTKGADKVLHYDERGYIYEGAYYLEGGMGIGARTNCPQSHHVLHVFLDYYPASGGGPVKRWLGALGGRPQQELPAFLPDDVASGTQATLRFELYELDCEQTGDVSFCAKGKLLSKTSAPAQVRRQGGWGRAMYDRFAYSVEDGSDSAFAVATLSGVLPIGALPQAGPAPTIFGVGYGIEGVASTRPATRYILRGEQFALHDKTPVPPKEAYFDDKPGIPVGLLWAYVHGTRGGHLYHYVASPANVVTDVVSFCPTLPNSLYRLPWAAGTIEKVTQGNDTEFTHSGSQKFAFDFVMENHTIIHAARGGVVESVEESLDQHSDAALVDLVKDTFGAEAANLYWKPGNHLTIRHQDDTFSYYTHMQKGGVYVSKGQFVERGDAIGKVGNTGNTTGPHLHFHVGLDGGGTVRIKFEALPITRLSCFVPPPAGWMSTNT